MDAAYHEILRSHARPLEPIPTGQAPVLAKLEGIRAVLFDLYGTLFISASGEVGTLREAGCDAAMPEALAAVGALPLKPLGPAAQCLFDVIETMHAAGRQAGIEYPEVDIVEVWRQVIADLTRGGHLAERTWAPEDLARLAVEYEARANPAWPMPGMEECLRSLAERRLALGIVSNGQFYTRELFPALLGRTVEACGFDPELQSYSYQHGRAKPGLGLYQAAAAALSRRGIEPPEALYVGNDMLNDVLPARQVGFRTALFAGDRRSLRLREGDPRLEGVQPDLLLVRLLDLRECLL